MASTIFVKSHVSRDLLQNAALFKTDKLVVWEYVSNGLQYVDPGTNPTVHVRLESKDRRIRISDNGRGMSLDGLRNFFIMHGENVDRKSGAPGRGRFGTGKSAAFGIGDVLRVTSIRDNRRSLVELTRTDLSASQSGDPVPVKVIESEVVTSEPNGTHIEILGVHLKSLDQAGIIRYIERQISRWPKNCTVFVNNHECEYEEPPIEEQRRFKPSGKAFEVLGDVLLTVRVAKSPIDEDLRGISIYSNGVWHETTLAGSEGKEMSNYLLGEIDVPFLDEDKSPISPFDLSRSMKLNPSNETVQLLYAFISQSIEQVRRDLVSRERERKASEEAKRLENEALEIARLINEDFDSFKEKISRVKSKSRGLIDRAEAASTVEDPGNGLDFGGDSPAAPTKDGGIGASGTGASGGTQPRQLNPGIQPDTTGAPLGREKNNRTRTQNRGGFGVQYKSMGAEEDRAVYVGEERTIYINLDHPQLAAAKGISTTDDPTFKRLSYEVAFTEYAIAVSSELGKRGEYSDWSDPIYEVRETVNRLARKGAHLYSA